MAAHHTLVDLYGPLVERLTQAMLADRSEEFHAVLESIKDERADDVTRELRVLAETLHDAMLKFRHEFRVADLTEREVPDARTRLEHVLKLTDEAAHRTMDLIERCVPLAEHMSQQLATANADCAALRSNLTEMMLAQSYQDLTGQIIRGVIRLVGEVETVLAHLMRMTGATGRQQKANVPSTASQGFGPAIPGVSQNTVSGQQDVDDLIANLGI